MATTLYQGSFKDCKSALSVLFALCCVLSTAMAIGQSLDTISICRGDQVELVARDSFASTIWGPIAAVPPNSIRRSITVSPEVSTLYYVELVPPTGPNRVRNADFDTLQANFTSDYTYTPNGPLLPGTFTITNQPGDIDPSFENCRDVNRNRGPERMMLVSSNGNTADAIYQQQIPVEPNKRYRIAIFASALFSARPQLEIRLNGQRSGDILIPDLAICNWKQYLFSWNSTTNTSLELEIFNTSSQVNVPFLLDGFLVAERFPSIFDSTFVLVNQRDTTTVSIGLCKGERYTANGLNLAAGQTGYYRASNSVGCDSIYQVNTFEYNFSVDTLWTDACIGETVMLNGVAYSTTGINCYTTQSLAGCDSLICEGVRFFDAQAVTSTVHPSDCELPNSASIEVNATGPGPFMYTWTDTSDTSSVRSNLADGEYSFTVVNAGGCSYSEVISLQNTPPLTWQEVPAVILDCETAHSAFAKTSGGLGEIEFSFRQNNLSVDFSQLAPGQTTLVATDERGCTIDTSTTFGLSQNASFTISGPRRLSQQEATYLVQGQFLPTDSIVWSFGESLSALSMTAESYTIVASRPLRLQPSTSGWLHASLAGNNPCNLKDSVYIELLAPVKGYFPSAFSPNNDGTNDVFSLVRDTSVQLIEQLMIFSRWGELLFKGENCVADQVTWCAWDGTSSKGTPVDTGVYLYSARLRLTTGETINVAGDVSLFADDN